MKRRTYGILEIWVNWGQDNQTLLQRTESWELANQSLVRHFNARLNDNDKFYLIETQVLVKVEKDDPQPPIEG